MINKELPVGSEVKQVAAHGASHWTRTAKISTQTEDGISQSFFLKVKAIKNITSSFIPFDFLLTRWFARFQRETMERT